jgi:hypothetical protein
MTAVTTGRMTNDWHRDLVTDRFNEIGTIAARTEKVLAPFVNEPMAKPTLRLRKLFSTAGTMLAQGEIKLADLYCRQCDGALIELRSLAKQAGIPGSQFLDRMLNP